MTTANGNSYIAAEDIVLTIFAGRQSQLRLKLMPLPPCLDAGMWADGDTLNLPASQTR